MSVYINPIIAESIATAVAKTDCSGYFEAVDKYLWVEYNVLVAHDIIPTERRVLFAENIIDPIN